MVHSRVDRGCQKVVGCRDGVDIAGHMQVEVFHRDDLRVAAASRPALDPKCGPPLRWLSDTGDNASSEMSAQSLAQTDRCGGLALTQGALA